MWINPTTDFSIITKETPTEKLWSESCCTADLQLHVLQSLPWVFNREVYVIFQSSDFIKYF